ncbi:NAD(P)-binding protein [Vararia minispora EC-137]|uniref:NAD(P)-binding protein n=1 Tax=Vararia minispora EC-137 TaxID=1314806 RepID=A0ACB8QLN5_9AGAM|nr:NAD(P)-binding protein [Vararia minispora EC-137]
MLSAKASLVHAQRAAIRQSKRAYHDLVVPSEKKPVVSAGPPGRSAVSGHVATVFGCTGFLGRYLVHKLAKTGTQVIVPYRDEDEKRHLKVMGDLGQVVPLEWDIRNDNQTAECVRHSDIVYNLVGRDYETKNFGFEEIHVTGPQRMAHIARESGVPRFIHVSHLNASPNSSSIFYRTKFEGENAVRDVFPDATIVRPGPMYGYEDKLLQNMAVWPIWWKLNNAATKIRPVHVMDVAQALANLERMDALPQIMSLPGPSTHTYAYLLELISTLTYNAPSGAPTLPKSLVLAAAGLLQRALFWPTLSPDEIERRYIDDVGADRDKKFSGDWDVVGIHPDEIERHAIAYVRRYRSAVNYARPIVLPARPVCRLKSCSFLLSRDYIW